MLADGQQRAVTGTMIAAAVRDLEPDCELKTSMQHLISTGDGTKPDEDRIRLREADADFFRKWVQAPGAMLATYTATDEQEPDGARSESQTNIINNRNFIINRVRALGSGGRRRLVSILEEQTDIVEIGRAHV